MTDAALIAVAVGLVAILLGAVFRIGGAPTSMILLVAVVAINQGFATLVEALGIGVAAWLLGDLYRWLRGPAAASRIGAIAGVILGLCAALVALFFGLRELSAALSFYAETRLFLQEGEVEPGSRNIVYEQLALRGLSALILLRFAVSSIWLMLSNLRALRTPSAASG